MFDKQDVVMTKIFLFEKKAKKCKSIKKITIFVTGNINRNIVASS